MGWYSAMIIYECEIAGTSEARPLREESIRIVRAASEAAALAAAHEVGRQNAHSYTNERGEVVSWRLVRVVDVQDLCEDELGHGVEVFSRMTPAAPSVDAPRTRIAKLEDRRRQRAAAEPLAKVNDFPEAMREQQPRDDGRVMQAGPRWSQLHDATLVHLECRWEDGRISFQLRTGNASTRDVQIVATGGRLVHCPRVHPWGSSVSINEVRGPSALGDEGLQRLEVEMQSGDVLVVEAESFRIVPG